MTDGAYPKAFDERNDTTTVPEKTELNRHFIILGTVIMTALGLQHGIMYSKSMVVLKMLNLLVVDA